LQPRQPPQHLFQIAPGAESWRARQTGGPGVRPGDLATLWRAAGLRDAREGQITIAMDFVNFADYWEPTIQGPLLPSLLHGLSPEWHERVRRAVESAFLVGDADGPRSFAATAWVVGECAEIRVGITSDHRLNGLRSPRFSPCYCLYTPLSEAPDRLAAKPTRGSPYQSLSHD
jgi:hypothetical protein